MAYVINLDIMPVHVEGIRMLLITNISNYSVLVIVIQITARVDGIMGVSLVKYVTTLYIL